MKDDMTKKLAILRIVGQDRNEVEDVVVNEHSATIMINDEEVVTLLCSPTKLECLAAGFLLSEGLIKSREEIITTEVSGDKQRSTVRVEVKGPAEIGKYASSGRLIASSGARGSSSGIDADPASQIKIESPVKISSREIIALVEKFHQCSPVFTETGGVHSAALCSTEDVLIFSDDIGRHNAIDKVFGECLLNDTPADERLIVTSGRVSSEILLKVARRNIPIIISVSAPTDVAVALADSLGITLVGFVRGNRMNVYTHSWRVTAGGRQQ